MTCRVCRHSYLIRIYFFPYLLSTISVFLHHFRVCLTSFFPFISLYMFLKLCYVIIRNGGPCHAPPVTGCSLPCHYFTQRAVHVLPLEGRTSDTSGRSYFAGQGCESHHRKTWQHNSNHQQLPGLQHHDRTMAGLVFTTFYHLCHSDTRNTYTDLVAVTSTQFCHPDSYLHYHVFPFPTTLNNTSYILDLPPSIPLLSQDSQHIAFSRY